MSEATETQQNEGAEATERLREQYRQDRERRDEWDKQPFPKSRDREREANERAYWRAVAEIPNPGPVEPLTELQAFHAEQTDPPPGPYPDPPLGPYPDPVIKERPSEEAVYGKAAPGQRRGTRQGERSGDASKGRAGARSAGTDPGGREYDEPNFDGYEPDIHERAEGPPGVFYANVGESSDPRASNVSRRSRAERPTNRGGSERSRSGETERDAGPENGGHAGRSATDRPADRPGER